MRTWIKRITLTLFLLLIISTSVISFLITTTPGLYLSLKLMSFKLPGVLHVKQLKGRLLDEFSIGELTYQEGNDHIQAQEIQVTWALKTFLTAHPLIKTLQIDNLIYKDTNPGIHLEKIKRLLAIHPNLNLNVDDVQIKFAEFKGHQLNHLKLKLHVTKTTLEDASLKFNINNHLVDLQLGFDKSLTGTLKLMPLPNAKYPIKGKFNVAGDLDNLNWIGNIGDFLSLEGSLKQLTNIKGSMKWNQLQWSALSSPSGRVQFQGMLPQLKVSWDIISAHEGQKPWKSNGTITGSFPWLWNFKAHMNRQHGPGVPVGIYSNISMEGQMSDYEHGTFKINLDPGHYQTIQQAITFKNAMVIAKLSKDGISGHGSWIIDSQKLVDFNFSLPQFTLLQWNNKQQAFRTHWQAHFKNLDFLKSISPEISNLQGSLTAALNASGTLAKPIITTHFSLEHAQCELPKLGLHLNPIRMQFTGNDNHWKLNGAIVSNQQSLNLSGEGRLLPSLNGAINIYGNNVTIANTEEYLIRISPKLQLIIKPKHMELTGEIHVPYADIKPQTFTNSLTLPDDVVYKTSSSPTQSQDLNVALNLSVILGPHVELTLKGLHALLGGHVVISQQQQGNVNGKGELSVIHGEYKAFGQNLKIEQGQLLFTGGRLDNPDLSLRAAKTLNPSLDELTSITPLIDFNANNPRNLNLGKPIKVGVEVSGKLNAPKIQLFSVPSILAQADILSMLVLGQPASQANKAGGQLLLTALTSMNLGTGANGAKLIEQLKQTVGIDINMQTTTNFNQTTKQFTESTGFVVGKKLSKRIYLSYNVGMTQTDPNVLTLKYLLSKMFSIQVSSSDTSSGIDLMYTASKKRRQ